MNRIRRTVLAVTTVGMLALTAACSGGGTGGSSAGGLQKVKICTGAQPDYAPLYVAKEMGMWKKYDIDMELSICGTTPLAIASILNDEMQAANSSVTGVSTAIGQGIPAKVVFPTTLQPTEGNTGVLVPADSPAKDYADLEGTTLGTITVQGLFQLGLENAMKIQGADPTKLKVVSAAPTDLQALLTSGKVGAVMVQDPTFTQIKEALGSKVRDLGNPFSIVPWGKDLVIGAVIASDMQLKKDPELYKKLREGWAEAVKLANDNPDVVNKVVPEYSGLDASLLSKITWGKWTTELPEKSTTEMLDTMLEYGFVKSVPKFSDIYWDGK